jgi:hypothetical protein
MILLASHSLDLRDVRSLPSLSSSSIVASMAPTREAPNDSDESSKVRDAA